MKVSIKTGKRPRIEMLPLIDIVFLLLVFFIYAMLSMAVHRALPVNLPSSSTAKIDKHKAVSVTLRSNGDVFLDKEKMEPGELGDSLKSLSSHRKKRGVLLFADGVVSYQDVFKVMDQIRIAGVTNISLQAEADQRP